MPFELYMLAAATLLFLLAFIPGAIYKTNAYGGLSWLVSNRDVTDKPPLTGAAARAERAHANLKENFPAFVAAILILSYTGHYTMGTAVASAVFVVVRLLYIPVYIGGIPPLRTLLWTLGWASTIFILAVAVFG
ncbi:MAG: MAPEG family protein [Gammaproteobacteria bacterium]